MEEKNFLYEDGILPLTADDLISKKDAEAIIRKNELFKVSAITHPLKEHARAVVDMIGELDRHPEVDCYRAYVTAAKEFVTR